MVNQRSWVHMLSVISRGCLWKIDVWVLPALLQRLTGWAVSAQTIQYTHSSSKEDALKNLQTVCWRQADYGLLKPCPVVWWDQNKLIWLRWCQVFVAATRVSCLQSCMVVGVSWSGAAWVLQALGSYSSLREPWMPTCTVTYWSRA